MSMLNRAFLQSLFARSMKSMKKTKMRIFLIMNFLKPPVSVCCQILRKASDHTIVLTEKLLNYFLKSKFGSFCALSYVEKCGQSEKVVHTKERGRGGVQYQHQQLFFTNTKKNTKTNANTKTKYRGMEYNFNNNKFFCKYKHRDKNNYKK